MFIYVTYTCLRATYGSQTCHIKHRATCDFQKKIITLMEYYVTRRTRVNSTVVEIFNPHISKNLLFT